MFSISALITLIGLVTIASEAHEYDLRSRSGRDIGSGASGSRSGIGSGVSSGRTGIGSGASASGSGIGSGASPGRSARSAGASSGHRGGIGSGASGGAGGSNSLRGDSLAVTVKGRLMCGATPAVAHVRLYPLGNSHSDDYVGADDTNALGDFHIDGNTAGRVNATLFEPMIAIYHQCDLDAGSNKHRHFKMHVPLSFINEGRIGRKPYDLGKINLQVIYPREDKIKDFAKTRLVESLLMLL